MEVPLSFGRRERRLPASTAGDVAMPLQPIASFVPRCVEGDIMEWEGEGRHCSGQNLWTLKLFYRVTEAAL